MRVKDRLEKVTVKKERFKIKNIFKNSIKKILVISMITTNMFFYMPIVTFAADNDDEERVPATVPAAANEIISKFVSVKSSGGSTTSGTGGVITNYEESGDGWDSVTEIKADNGVTRTYRNYKQYDNGNSYWNYPYWGGDNIWGSGCGPTSLAIIASGYHMDVNPKDVVDIIHGNGYDETNGEILSEALSTLGIENELENVGIVGTDTAIEHIKQNLQNGNPVAVGVNGGTGYSKGGHWMALVGIDGDTITISNPGGDTATDDISRFVRTCMQRCSYILAKDSRSSVSSSSSSSNSSSSSSSANGQQSSNSASDVNSTGYTGIHKSGITGREYKEYKQNASIWSGVSYVNGNTIGHWGCGLTSDATLCTGYGYDVTPVDINSKYSGGYNIGAEMTSLIGRSNGGWESVRNYSTKQLLEFLEQGCVFIVHTTGPNDFCNTEHYIPVIDVDGNNIYSSDPWIGNPTGWLDADYFFSNMNEILMFSKDGGSIGNYGGVASLDNFLFIGDSRTAGIESKLEALGNNIIAKGVVNSTPQHWKEVTKTGSGTVLNTSVTLPSKESVKGVAVALGVNNTSQVSEMKEVLNNLLARYPNVPIFVMSVFYVGSGYQVGTLNATAMNSNIDQFNNSIKEFCISNSNLTYIDITSGLYDSGALKSSYTNDNLHLNDSGNDILVESIKNAILNSGLVSSKNLYSTSSVNMSGNIVANDRNGYKINIDLDKEIDGMLETLKEKNFKLEKYLDKSVQKEYLKNMIKAAIVTQYPDLRSAEEIAKDPKGEKTPLDETQGCIKVKRYSDDETRAFAGNSLSNPVDDKDEEKGMYLAYKPYQEFSKLIGNVDKSVFNYFSLDSSNNLVVAGWETLDVSVTIEQIGGTEDPSPDAAPAPRANEYSKLVEKKVNYINQITNYTVPFSFMWSLLVYGNDEEFVNDFAKLVIDTEIVIASYDATNVKVTTYTDTYIKNNSTISTAKIGNYTSGYGYQSEAQGTASSAYAYQVTEIHTLKTDTPNLKIKYANTWTAIYNNNYRIRQEEREYESGIVLPDEEISSNYEDITINGDVNLSEDDLEKKDKIEQSIEDNKELQEDIDAKIEELKNETHKSNQERFAYRYPIIEETVSQEATKLLQEEDIQNYVINMIILGNSKDGIKKIFEEDEVIIRYAKKINQMNYYETIKDLISVVNRIVENSTEKEDGKTSLWDKLTKNGTDTETNKIYSAEVTSLHTETVVKHTVQQEKIKTDTTTLTVEEVTTNGNVTMKTDKNSNENSFVKLLCHSKSAKGNLDIIGSWFFESMEKTAAIADMEDLVKYLFQFVYKKNYGIEDQEDINEIINLFDPEKLSSISSGDIQGNTIEEKVWYALRSAGYSEYAVAGAMGNIYQESAFDVDIENSIGAVGLCQWLGERKTGLINYASSKGKNWQDEEVQIEYILGELTPGGGADGYATYQFMSNHGYSPGDWEKANSIQEAVEAFCYMFERCADWETNISGRVKFAENYYNKFHGKDLLTFKSSSSGNYSKDATGTAKKILEAAESKLGCPYEYAASGPNKFDCGGFTMWCYAQAGITISHADQYSDAERMGDVLPVEQAKPGDILWKSGHVGLCVSNENGVITYIHAPQSGDVVGYSTYSQFTNALRFF